MSKKPKGRDDEVQEKQTRIAIVNQDKCKPKKCRQECKKSCPVVRMGKLCIEVHIIKNKLKETNKKFLANLMFFYLGELER